MKRPLGAWLGFVSICLWLGQGADFVPALPDLRNSAIEKPFFYTIEKDGVTSYLLGTQHIGVQLKQFPPQVAQALAQSPIFLAEDLDNDQIEPDLGAVKKFERELLSPRAVERFRRRGINLEKLTAKDTVIKPCVWYAYWEAGPQWARLDKELEKLARDSKKNLIALDEAAHLTRAVTQSSQLCDLNKITAAMPPKAARQNYLNGVARYFRGSEAEMAVDDTGDRMMLISERNRAWLPKILKAHKTGAFVAVGAAHLFGEAGLIRGLEERGYKITRFVSDRDTRLHLSQN